MLGYVIENVDNEEGSTVDACLVIGEIGCTHFFNYLEEDRFEHEGIDGAREELTYTELIAMYPTTMWTIIIDDEGDEDE